MIKLLPSDLINKIAAGEVVERPASVVKELTENAVDSRATRIEIKLEQGGSKLIQVIDNGSGMSEEDARLCLVRHATSKISSVDDLFNIHTLGFRGEALASIASVSQFSLVTRQEGSAQGSKVSLDAGQQLIWEPTAANEGTTVTVNNIFYNVPARQKFLKTPGTEFTHILRYLQQLSLIHPELELKLVHNTKTIFHYYRSDWQDRVEQVLGKDFSSKLLPLLARDEGIRIEGFIAKPELVHASHSNQYLFVNDRPVYDHLVNRSVLEGYGTLVPRGYFPAFVLKLSLDPQLVDVNVHPRKSEVKFLNPSRVINLLVRLVKTVLNSNDLARSVDFSQKRENLSIPRPRLAEHWQPGTSEKIQKPSYQQVTQAIDFNQQFSSGIECIKKSPLEERGWNVLGQIHRSFILVETPEGLQILDQHALSEITNYSRLMKERENGEVCSQQLLLPTPIEVSPEEKNIIQENQELFSRLGWEIDELSDDSIQISALPEILKHDGIESIFHDLLDELKNEKEPDQSKRELALLKFEACRGAVMFGDSLSFEEMKGLLNQWLQVENNAACEHGRPAAARISVEEMRKYFKR
ncbi:MAG: DNA mismatch repair endonuclease MutL [bacterium]|nr:DNA mismatch repair endonuclease MutL [bacterium]